MTAVANANEKGILETIRDNFLTDYRNSVLARLGSRVSVLEILRRIKREYERLRLAEFPRPDVWECYRDIEALLIHPDCDWRVSNKEKLEKAERILMGIVNRLKGQHQPPGCWKCKSMNLTEHMPRCKHCNFVFCPTCGKCGCEYVTLLLHEAQSPPTGE